MDRHSSARAAADEFVCHYQLKNVTLDNLVPIVGELGFQIIDYEIDGSDYAACLISELGLYSIASQRKAFVYQTEDVRLLFISERLSQDEKLYALAHELGHIKCGHLQNAGIPTHELSEEFEANEFAHYLLYPRLKTVVQSWIMRHKRTVAALLFAIIIVIVSSLGIHHYLLEKSYHGEYYVTENGEKYHIENCISIRGREGVRRLTEEEYISGKYEACNICCPE